MLVTQQPVGIGQAGRSAPQVEHPVLPGRLGFSRRAASGLRINLSHETSPPGLPSSELQSQCPFPAHSLETVATHVQRPPKGLGAP